jgi:hypothetical protein
MSEPQILMIFLISLIAMQALGQMNTGRFIKQKRTGYSEGTEKVL